MEVSFKKGIKVPGEVVVVYSNDMREDNWVVDNDTVHMEHYEKNQPIHVDVYDSYKAFDNYTIWLKESDSKGRIRNLKPLVLVIDSDTPSKKDKVKIAMFRWYGFATSIVNRSCTDGMEDLMVDLGNVNYTQ